MKQFFLAFAAGTIFLASCSQAPNADKAGASDSGTVATAAGNAYKADLTASKVEFIGTKVTGSHHGTIALQSGEATAEAGELKSGKFVIDMNTLKTDDQDSTGNAKLTGHLKGDDFFKTTANPTATFEISGVRTITAEDKDIKLAGATHIVTGNFTMMGVTKSISFPAKLSVSDSNIAADADFNIDRTQWGLTYTGQADNLIRNDVNIKLHFVAGK